MHPATRNPAATLRLHLSTLRPRQLAACHVLLAGSIVGLAARKRRAVALCWLAVGLGGVGAGWGRWTENNGGWLDLAAAWKRPPSRQAALCMAEHGPFAVAGAWLLWRGAPAR